MLQIYRKNQLNKYLYLKAKKPYRSK